VGIPPEEGYKELLDDWKEEEIEERVSGLRQIYPFKRGEIEFRGVSVCYRREMGDVLRGVSFRVRAGEKIGVVGRTGCGKSTLFLTLLRIIEAHDGAVFIDGIDTRRVSLCTLRASINFILQEHFLFAGTVRAVHILRLRTSTLRGITRTRKWRRHWRCASCGRECGGGKAWRQRWRRAGRT
jgi:ABC-type multidrug transport system fused ATPase/permease subunit